MRNFALPSSLTSVHVYFAARVAAAAKKHRMAARMAFVLSTALLAPLLSSALPSSNFAPGDLDPTFDGDGIVVSQVSALVDNLRSIEIQPDGKIVVCGGLSGPGEADFVLARYNPNGTLDSTFDADGLVQTSFLGLEGCAAIALLPDGKIAAVGATQVPGGGAPPASLAVARYNSDGSLDTTFDGDGKVVTTIGSFFAVRTITVQPDGKIIAGGGIGDGFDFNTFFYRYNTNGSLDSTFDGDGKVLIEVTPNDDDALKIAVQPDGKIVSGGFGIIERTPNVFDDDYIVVRLNPNGSLDTTLDGDGKVITPIGPNLDRALGMALQPDGKIVLTGFTQDLSFNWDIATVRYNSDGSLDTTFDGDGKTITPIGAANDIGSAVRIQTDGKIVVAGSASNGTNSDFAAIRYNPNGSLDTTFSGDGKVITPVGGGDDGANALAIQADGKIVLAGNSIGPVNQDFTLVRYLGDVTAPILRSPFDFDGDGKTDASIFRPAAGEWWYSRSSNGASAALQFGSSTDRLAPADFTGDGKADIAFWRPSTGQWFILRSEDNSYLSFPFGADGDVPVPADYDGDGRSDAAVFRPSSSIWFILKSSGGTLITTFGVAGDRPVVADYDGDGKADIAIYRPSAGQWWYAKSSNGATVALAFGTDADRPVQGDYTGDGKADIAFFRPSTGFWFILRSEDNSFFSIPFGAAGDTPVIGDFDGDGKHDLAVFRPANQNWFVSRSSGGTSIFVWGALGDLPVPGAFVP